MRYLFKACQTFFCVFGMCYGTGTSVGKIYLEAKSSYVSYVVHDERQQFQHPCLDIDHRNGHVRLRAMKPGGRALEDILVLTGEDLKTKTKPEAERKFMEICAQVNPDIDVGELTKQDMIRLAQEAFIGARSPRKKTMRSSSGVFRNSAVKHFFQSPALDLDMLTQIPVNESDLETMSTASGSDQVSTASGSTPIISDDSDGSKTPSTNGDISDPATSDVPEIISDVSDQGSESGSIETDASMQEMTVEDTQEELNISVSSVGVNTSQNVGYAENPSGDQVNYIGNESEINLTKQTINFDSSYHKKFNPNAFIRWLIKSVEHSRLVLKTLQGKLVGKIDL